MSEKQEPPDIQKKNYEKTPRGISNTAKTFSRILLPVIFLLILIIGITMYLNYQKAEVARLAKNENARVAAEKLAKEEALKLEQEKQEAIEETRKEAWDNVIAFRDEAMKNPEFLSSTITKFHEIKKSLKGTDYESKADIEIASLESAMKKAVAQLIAELVKKASEPANKKDFKAASDIFRNYSGPLAQETNEERLKLAETYLASERDMIEVEKQFKQKKSELLKHIASLILKNKISDSLDAYNEFISKHSAENIDDLSTVKSILQTIQNPDRFLLESCRNDVGKKITVKTDGPYESVEISRIKDDNVYVKRQMGATTVETKISVANLSPEEKIKRSDRMDNASKAVFIAMIEVELGNYENAGKALHPGDLLSEHLANTIKDMKREFENKKSAESTKLTVKEDSTPKEFIFTPQHITVKADANTKSSSKERRGGICTVQDINLSISLSNTSPADFTNNKIEVYLFGESTAENHLCQVLAIEKKDLALKKNESLELDVKANTEFNKLSVNKYGAEYSGYLIVIKDKTGKIFMLKANKSAFQKIADKIMKMTESSEFDDRTGEERKGVVQAPPKH